jgi:hypothetical protein
MKKIYLLILILIAPALNAWPTNTVAAWQLQNNKTDDIAGAVDVNYETRGDYILADCSTNTCTVNLTIYKNVLP